MRSACLLVLAAAAPLRAQGPGAPEPRDYAVPPALAAGVGMMSLGSTNADRFRRAFPAFDGRGVLIAILDSGLDPTIPGLDRTSTGERKVLDLRDFSGEGRIALERVAARGDTVVVAGRALAGAAVARALAEGQAPWWGGVLRERPLGAPPAGDLNGDGDDEDVYPLLVVRASDGWVLFADTDGDGSLVGERPVRDYLVAQETFGFGPPGARPLSIGVNLADEGGSPRLDLVFDTSGHGSHVAGIAAGHRIYGLEGYDGVAPGAQLLGLKISDNAQGGITTDGSMLRAIRHAIAFARARQRPLVLNMSFGVGNEAEGRARIDAIVDSVLEANPDLVFAISAGNDGPGLSTLGFPGSASQALSVGASLPTVFQPPAGPGRGVAPEQVAYFSSRGGETGKPDLVAPGVAFSTVPAWDRGGEIEFGTSMASPHAAGLAALLVSGLAAEGRRVEARAIRQALVVTARPLPGAGAVDQGTGLADVDAAWRWLQQPRTVPDLRARPRGRAHPALLLADGIRTPADTLQLFDLTRVGPAPAMPEPFTLRTDAAWLAAPRGVSVGRSAAVALRLDRRALARPGVYVGTVTGWPRDTTLGPAVRLPVTVVVPHGLSTDVSERVSVGPQAVARVPVLVDSAAPFELRVEAATPRSGALVAVHQPGGQPRLGGGELEAGWGPDALSILVDGRDAVAGPWEVALVPLGNTTAEMQVDVRRSPVRLAVRRAGDTLVARAEGRGDAGTSGTLALLLAGTAERRRVAGTDGRRRDLPIAVPAWARRLVVDVAMPRAQWPRFTDFGVSLFDADGRQLGTEPMNYHRARLEQDLPDDAAARGVVLGLFPGHADEAPTDPWTLDILLRFYGDSVATARPVGAADTVLAVDVRVAARGAAEARFAAPASPWPAPAGHRALVIVAFDAQGRTWTHEHELDDGGEGR